MATAPLRKHSEIAERIQLMESALDGGEQLNEVVWQGIKTDLIKLKSLSSEAAQSWMGLAYIQLFRGAEGASEFRTLAPRALAMMDQNPSGYEAILKVAGLLAEPEIFDLVISAAEKKQTPLDLKVVATYLVFLGRLHAAADIIQKNSHLFQDGKILRKSHELIEASDYLSNLGITDADTSARVILAAKSLMVTSNRALSPWVVEPTVAGVIFAFICSGSDDFRADCEFRMYEALCEAFDEPMFDALSILVYPSDVLDKFSKLAAEGKN